MVKNRTTSLMYPFYSTFGNEFINVFNNVSDKYNNVSLYLGDWNYKNYNGFQNFDKFLDDDLIFVKIFEEVLSFEKNLLLMQSHKNYVADYTSTNGIIVVFKLDEPYITALRHLKKDEYSKMYKKELIDSYYDESKFWYLKYNNEIQSASFNVFTNNKLTTIEQHKEKWDNLQAVDFFNNLMLSPYHVLHKSENLRNILEYIYNAKFPKENELIEKIKLKNEILNYGE